jgi:hypothetical protein
MIVQGDAGQDRHYAGEDKSVIRIKEMDAGWGLVHLGGLTSIARLVIHERRDLNFMDKSAGQE